MEVITISGKGRHGKDTTAKIMKRYFEERGKKVCIIHYADYLKYIAKEYFGWDGAKDVQGRTLLQRLGTDIARQRNPNMWVNVVTQFIDTFMEDFDYIIIPDTRFPNEILGLRQRGYNVFSLWIFRNDFDNGFTPEQKAHPSETSLDDFPFDAVLSSPSGYDQLENKVTRFLSGSQRFQ